MIYAQILNGVVQNIIVLKDASLIPIFSDGFDSLIQIDNVSPVPGIGWPYDGQKFTQPDPIISPSSVIVAKINEIVTNLNSIAGVTPVNPLTQTEGD